MGKLKSNIWHHLLLRQLKKAQSGIDKSPENDQWQSIMALVNESYNEADQERYLLERSLKISSEEMQELYAKSKLKTEQRIQDITDAFPDMLLLLSEEGIVLDLLSNAGFENILPNGSDFGKFQPVEFLLDIDLASIIRKKIENINNTNQDETFNYKPCTNNNDTVYEIRMIRPQLQDNTNVFCLLRNISDLVKSQNRFKHLAHHDPLTNLPNRLDYYETLKHTINQCQIDNNSGGVLFFDIDRFKSINDALGHQVGDELIVSVAKQIPMILSDNEFFARMSGDEFIVIIKNSNNEQEVKECADRIIDSFDRPFELENHKIEIKVSIGISLFPGHSMDADELTQFADTAMYAAKDLGGNQIQVFNKSLISTVRRNFEIEQELRRAIQKNELYMVYQPQFCLRSGDISGFESLIRWKPKNKSLISPARFIPIAELTGYIEELGLWIIETTCQQIKKWKQKKLPFIKIAINLSRIQLTDPLLAHIIFDFMDQFGIESSELVFEITEDSIIKNNAIAINTLNLLNDRGIAIAIDDFGSGYSSFFDLKKFPFSTLKIDKSIIDGINVQSNDDAIVRAIIAMGRELGMQIVAEGVETQQQLEFLKENHCTTIQGYLLGKPLHVSQAEEILKLN